MRIDWETVGRIISRVCADELDPDRLQNLFEIGIDEVSWRKGHKYLTLVCDGRSCGAATAPAQTPPKVLR